MAEREPTMEEIVVALRETKRRADHTLPLALVGQSRSKRPLLELIGSTDAVGLRDEEMERLLAENARLNARVVALLKIIEQEQSKATEAARDDTPTELDQEAIGDAVKAAVKAELSPLLDLLLHALSMRAANPVGGIESMSRKPPRAGASDWIVDLMERLEGDAGAPQEPDAALDPTARRRSKLRERLTDVINAFRLDPYPPSRRFTPPEGPS